MNLSPVQERIIYCSVAPISSDDHCGHPMQLCSLCCDCLSSLGRSPQRSRPVYCLPPPIVRSLDQAAAADPLAPFLPLLTTLRSSS